MVDDDASMSNQGSQGSQGHSPSPPQNILQPSGGASGAPLFALNPAQAFGAGAIDMTVMLGKKFCSATTKPQDPEHEFKLNPVGMRRFPDMVKMRCQEHGWSDPWNHQDIQG